MEDPLQKRRHFEKLSTKKFRFYERIGGLW
jgi:hypothetical protein